MRSIYRETETLCLSILGAYLYARTKSHTLQYFGAPLALGNSLLRIIPSLMVLLIPLFTGKTHVEDEYETGELLVNKFGSDIWLYVPAIISIGITLLSIIWVSRTASARKITKPGVYAAISFVVFYLGMILAMILDGYIRINWSAG